MKSNNYCIIMAGGVGSRFWPLSKTKQPKQFLDVLGTGSTLIQSTYNRLKAVCPPENFFVVTNDIYKDLVEKQLSEINPENILVEPMRRNTAPCIEYAVQRIQKENPDAVMVVSPADHIILKEQTFVEEITKGLNFVGNNDALLTFGIQPTRPDTGYGYIQIDADNKTKTGQFVVKDFTEKPNEELAKKFVESGEFFWNSGIFLWSVDAIQKQFADHLPEMKETFDKGVDLYGTDKEKPFIDKIYPACESISIDYGVMERANNVFVQCVDIDWSDLGTWGALHEEIPHDEFKNATKGEKVFVYDTQNCMINSPHKLTVIDGLDDYIIVDTPDALLICKKSNEQSIKQFVGDVSATLGEDYI